MKTPTPSSVITARVLAIVQTVFNAGCALLCVWVATLAYQSGRYASDSGGTARFVTVGFIIAVASAAVMLSAATLTGVSAVLLPRRRRRARTTLIAVEAASAAFFAVMVMTFVPRAAVGTVVAAAYVVPAVIVIVALLSEPARRWSSVERSGGPSVGLP